jgi:hypothetical protein
LKKKEKPSTRRKNLKEFTTTKPTLKKILKGFLHTEEES